MASRGMVVAAGVTILLAVGSAFAKPPQDRGKPTKPGKGGGEPVTYMLTDQYGGTWADAEKTLGNTEDDLMCWAAASSNVLEWTGWGKVSGMTTTDEMFAYYQDHWTDNGGHMLYGWDWWFDGTNDGPSDPSWSQVDVSGGGFHTGENFSDYFRQGSAGNSAMTTVDQFLHDGYGTSLAIYTGGGGGHAITVWGMDYLPKKKNSTYLGLWITDSDDNKGGDEPRPDELRYYDVAQGDGLWYLQDYYGTSNTWYVGGVFGLAQSPEQLASQGQGEIGPAATLPEPTTMALLIAGAMALSRRRRRRAARR